MTAKSTVTTVILFEDEIRLCAKLMTEWLALEGGEDDDAYQHASGNLLRAMMAALAGADDENAILVLGRKSDMMLRAEKKRAGERKE